MSISSATPTPSRQLDRYQALVVLGGPMHVTETDRYPHLLTECRLIEQALAQRIPVLGICLGAQLLAHVLGARVAPAGGPEIGWYPIRPRTPAAAADPVLHPLDAERPVFQWHSYGFEIPAGAVHLAESDDCPGQAMSYDGIAWGFQFHLELDESLIRRWLNSPGYLRELEASGLAQTPAGILEDTGAFSRTRALADRSSATGWPGSGRTGGAGCCRRAEPCPEPPAALPAPDAAMPDSPREFLGVFRYSRRALELVWTTSRRLTLILAVVTVLAGVLPAAIAYVGALIIDAVVAAARLYQDSGTAQYREVMTFVALEGGLVAALAGAQRAVCLPVAAPGAARPAGQRHDPREGAAARAGAVRGLRVLRQADARAPRGLEPAAVAGDADLRPRPERGLAGQLRRAAGAVLRLGGAVLVLAGLPAFLAEAKFSGDAFRLFRWRSPETRMQMYLETVLAREDHAKEVQLFGLGPRCSSATAPSSQKLYREDRNLTLRRDGWGFVLGLIGTLTLYGAYAWVAVTTILGRITLGQMTMYMMLFRQGQSAVSASLSAIGGMYEDNLYLSTLYEFLETPVPVRQGLSAHGPGSRRRHPLRGRELHLPGRRRARAVGHRPAHPPGRIAGAGRRERLRQDHPHQAARAAVQPTEGRILLDGLDLQSWDETALRQRIGVIFQDFARYQLKVGENIGAGDVRHFEDEARWTRGREAGHGAAVHRVAARGLQRAARQVVQAGPRAVRRPVAEDRPRARLHALRGRHPRARRADRRHGRRPPRRPSSSTSAASRATASPS
jgi:ATP-binding cassette, subfamily B, bacterial